MASTYGAWFISLFVETVLYGVGILQAFLYYQWWGTDSQPTKLAATKVLSVMVLETVQLGFFFGSSYSRFVQRFGILQEDLIWWANFRWSGLILCAYHLSIFEFMLNTLPVFLRVGSTYVVDSGVHLVSREQARGSIVGVYTVGLLAVLQLCRHNSANRCFSSLRHRHYPSSMHLSGSQTEHLLNGLMINAVNRGFLTAIMSTLTMILFLVFPHSFWFFLSIAPNSKLLNFSSVHEQSTIPVMTVVPSLQKAIPLLLFHPTEKEYNNKCFGIPAAKVDCYIIHYFGNVYELQKLPKIEAGGVWISQRWRRCQISVPSALTGILLHAKFQRHPSAWSWLLTDLLIVHRHSKILFSKCLR
ncbi:hypothetical protein C8F04DRAFT_1305488 [Mycena alexandri]|uniref:Uncharacterized protein n=1 Tax=Mycena alexandri TaxID=1745969 RepID=A0AAD6XAI5_9AGAR|nr:hypothetical protein C8F04DRAFT_1305488 [Mycena alexandri]